MKVVEIFTSIDGEGVRAGLPTVFVRLHGCNLHCTYCDTRYGCEGNDYTEMTIREVVDRVSKAGPKSVTVTGGEPLIQPGIRDLLLLLVAEGYDVNVETNGTVIPPLHLSSQREGEGRVFYTMDYKTGASGMSSRMNADALNVLQPTDVLKFVVGSVADMDQAVKVLGTLESHPCVFFSPVWGSIEPHTIVEYLLEHRLFDYKVQLQMHKIIWDPNERGV